jgi:hypothetical protein
MVRLILSERGRATMSEIINTVRSKEILKITLSTKKTATMTYDNGQVENIIQEKDVDVNPADVSPETLTALMEKF